MIQRLITAFLLLLWLSGCAVWPAATTPDYSQGNGSPDLQLQQKLRNAKHWALEGKLAIRTTDQSHSARIQWQQQGTGFDIHLSGPAGLKATHIYGMPGGVVFEQGDHTEQAGTAEALSQKLIGWPLPAEQLSDWILGLPSHLNTVERARYTPEGWLAELQQDGWHIVFNQYTRYGEWDLPGRIEAKRDDLLIILLAKRWDISP
jgi:outer membrane lipoprotein LolB